MPLVAVPGGTAPSRRWWDANKGSFFAHGVLLLTLRAAQIDEITGFLDREAVMQLGLPGVLGQ